MKWIWLFLLALLLYLLRFSILGYGILGDGNGYYSYANTLYFQKNLDFGPIYAHLAHFQGKNYVFSRIFWDTTPTITNQLPNPWLIGTAILWLPGMALIDGLVKLLQINANRFSPIYELGPGLMGIFLGIAGLYFLEKFLSKYFSKRTANFAVLTLFLTTNLFYYIGFEPGLSHSAVFFLVAFFLYRWQKNLNQRSSSGWLELGFFLGLITITRIDQSILGLLMIPMFFHHRQKEGFKIINKIGLFSLGLIGGLLPQLLNQLKIYNSFFSNAYLNGQMGTFSFQLQSLFVSLFSIRRGLFTWSPTLLLATIGLLIKNKANNQTRLWFVFALVCHWLIISSWTGLLSAGFGNRFFIGSLPLLAFGLANFLEKVNPKSIKIIIFLGFIWNVLLLNQFFFDKERLVDSQGLTPQNFFIGQLRTPIEIFKAVKVKGWDKTLKENFLE